MNQNNNQLPARRREPLTDTQLLLTITICIFLVMYVAAILIWGGGFKKPQMLLWKKRSPMLIERDTQSR